MVKKYGKALKVCKRCGNVRGVIRKYGLYYCRRCFREIAKSIGFKKYAQLNHEDNKAVEEKALREYEKLNLNEALELFEKTKTLAKNSKYNDYKEKLESLESQKKDIYKSQ